MKKVIEILGRTPGVSDWKINLHRRESSEIFFIKGEVDCVRRACAGVKIFFFGRSSITNSHRSYLP